MRGYLYTLLLVSSLFEMSTAITEGLANQLRAFADGGLRVNRMQDHLDSSPDFTFTSRAINGSASLRQAADLMTDKYRGRIQILQRLKQDIEDAYSDVTRSNPYTNCRNVRGNEFDSSLQQEVDYDNLCVAGNGLERSPSEFLPTQLVESWKATYQQEPGLQYIYFGSEEGIIYNYPSVNFDSPDYDPRFRPFYVESVTPKPKDVVIVIDRSGSMNEIHNGRKLMSIANEAAIAVIDTLTANDRVGVVAFSDNPETPPGTVSTSTCYGDQLAMGTGENKDYLKSFVRSISEGGGTRYLRALRAAFRFFENSETPQHDSRDRSRAKVIIFLTDGRPNDNSAPDGSPYPFGGYILEEIRNLNGALDNEVVIITFGLGMSLDDSAKTLLQNMADQVLSDEANGEVTRGERVLVSNPDNLRSEMATYYNLFLQIAGQAEPTFTVPYQDAFGSGLIASICMPVSAGTTELTLKGVICIDQTLGELLSELTYFQIGESSYSFMVDKYTRVLEHPNVANPTFITNTPRFTYLDTLETEADTMIQAMKRGESGELEVNARMVISRGNTDLEGVNVVTSPTHYYWAQVEGTGYTIGIAIKQGDTQAIIELNRVSNHFFYHKLELEAALNNIEECAHFHAVSVRDENSIHFSLAAFQQPFEYFYKEESVIDLQRYQTYFTSSVTSPLFQDQIREYVSATSYFRELMRDTDYDTVCIWRYLATENGIYRNFPASELPKDYDATSRQWYIQAKSNRDVMTLTAPYEDALGGGTVLSLTHVLYEGKDQHDASTDLIIGVMGMDFTPSFVYYMITDNVPQCQTHECFLIDRAGYILVHHDWIESPSFSQNLYNIHISVKESAIAKDMVERNLMSHEACVNARDIRKQYFWRVTVTSYSGSNYDIYNIDNTNAFLIIKKSDFFSNPTCSACTGGYYSCGFTPGTQDRCFCPCFGTDRSFYDFCEALFEISSDSDPVCTPSLPEVDFESVQRAGSSLDTCYDYNCEQYTTSRDCTKVIGCNWCLFTLSGSRLADPYCSDAAVCPHGILAASDDGGGKNKGGKGSGEGGEEGGSLWWIALIVLALIALVVGIALFVYFKRKQSNTGARRADNYNAANNQNPVTYHARTNTAYAREPATNPTAPAFGHAGPPAFGHAGPPSLGPGGVPAAGHVDAPPPYDNHQQHVAVHPGTGYMYQ